jgi:hypothetical protein
VSPNRTRVLVAPLFRQRGPVVGFIQAPPATLPGPVRRPARVSRMLALAHHIQRAIDAGKLSDGAEAARRFGLTRARLSQLLSLLVLAPDVQDAVLHAVAVDGQEPFTERTLRPITRLSEWERQRTHYGRLLPGRWDTPP